MKLVHFALVVGAVRSDDYCRLLCELDGRAVCTEGSEEGSDGKCRGYRFKTNGEICYRGEHNSESCPQTGTTVTNADANGIVRFRLGAPSLPEPSGSSTKKYPEILRSPSGETYILTAPLDAGTQAFVFLGVGLSDKRSFAIKKFRSATDPSAAREVGFLRTLKGIHGFPQLIDEFEYEGENYIVMEQLGRSLKAILQKSDGFSPGIAGAIGLQLIDRMQTLHGLGIGHHDLYPGNINMGMNGDRFQVFLIDFGWADSLKYAGKDDAQALVHSVMQVLNPQTKYRVAITRRTNIAEVCAGLPTVMEELFIYVYRTLKDQRPDYDYMRTLMRQLAPDYDGTVPLE